MILNFHPQAEHELLGNIEYYEDKQSGLGEKFLLDAKNTLRLILSSPIWEFRIQKQNVK